MKNQYEISVRDKEGNVLETVNFLTQQVMIDYLTMPFQPNADHIKITQHVESIYITNLLQNNHNHIYDVDLKIRSNKLTSYYLKREGNHWKYYETNPAINSFKSGS